MYDTLVLSGGAVRGFGLLGSVQFLQDRTWLVGIRKFVGTSIGAIISYLICIGYAPTEIMVAMCQKDYFEKMSSLDLMGIMNGGGAVSFSLIQEQLEKMTVQKIKRYISLRELHERFGKELICCTYNKTLEKSEYISFRSHPDMCCLTALKMSASLPFLFDEFIYEDAHYIDGAIVDNFPISQVAPEDHAIAIRLGVHADTTEPHQDQNLVSRFYSTLLIPMQRLEDLIIESNPHVGERLEIVTVRLPSYNALLLNVSTKDKFDMFSVGYDTMRQYFMGRATASIHMPSSNDEGTTSADHINTCR